MSIEAFADRFPFGQSLWHATAPPPPAASDFAPGAHYDVVIVGAGVAGVTAALRLQAAGTRVAVVEAQSASAGATGRAGGLIVPTFSAIRPGAIIARYREQGEALLASVAASADALFALAAEHGVDCGGAQEGWFQPAHVPAVLERSAADVAIWQSVGAKMEIIDGAEVALRTGVVGYYGAALAERGGALHPVKLVLGLLKRALEHGAHYFPATRVQRLERTGGRWTVATSRGLLQADRLLICTNGRSEMLGSGLENCVIPLHVCQIATEPLPPESRRRLLQRGQSLSDTRANLFTYRFDEDWRLITGAMPVLPAGSGRALARSMCRRLARLLDLPEVPRAQYIWFGSASVTTDRLPAIYDAGPGAWALTSCNARGIAQSSMLASRVADVLLGAPESSLPVPITPARPVPYRSVQRIGARFYSAYGRARDALGV